MVNLKHSFAMQEESLVRRAQLGGAILRAQFGGGIRRSSAPQCGRAIRRHAPTAVLHPPQGITEKESEDLRGMFVHTNPVLLYVVVARLGPPKPHTSHAPSPTLCRYTTVAVSALHMLFDVLAFKNDLSFWSSVDTMEGLSTRSLLLNEVMEPVILLYLLEQESSWLVQIGSVLTLALGLFKIVKSRTVKKADQAKAKTASRSPTGTTASHFAPPAAARAVGRRVLGALLVYGYHKGWYCGCSSRSSRWCTAAALS